MGQSVEQQSQKGERVHLQCISRVGKKCYRIRNEHISQKWYGTDMLPAEGREERRGMCKCSYDLKKNGQKRPMNIREQDFLKPGAKAKSEPFTS